MSVIAVHHAGRTVADMDTSLEFYRDLLGLRVVDDDTLEGPEVAELVGLPEARLRAVMLSVDGEIPFAELIQYYTPASRPLRGDEVAADIGDAHFCFLVDDLDAETTRLQAAGVRFTGKPLVVEEGSFADSAAAYCYDPDGLLIELWADRH